MKDNLILLVTFFFIAFACQDKKEGIITKENKSKEYINTSLAKQKYVNNKYNCSCPKNELTDSKVDTVFTLSNNKQIALCGYKNEDETYSEFVLVDCDESKIIGFWGAVATCDIKTSKDTLLVNEIIMLPVEDKNKYTPIVWTIEKFFFSGNNIRRQIIINPHLPKYSKEQIDSILVEYETNDLEINENSMLLLNRLFVASISGSKTAHKYFYDFPNKIKLLDGAYSEEYNDLKYRLEVFKKIGNSK